MGIAKKIDSRNYTAEYNRLLNDPGITFDEKSSKITVDASKLSNKAIGQAISRLTGVHSLAIPDKIDRTTYDALMTLKQDPARESYLKSIRPRLSKESYDAAVSRLDDVIAHVEKLKPEQIIDENGWTNVQEAPHATGKVSVIKDNGQQKLLGGEIASDVNEVFCPSYFARDGIDKKLEV